MNAALPGPGEVLGFWFGDEPVPRAAWFAKDEAFDDEVRVRFGAAITAAHGGLLPAAWSANPLAEIVLLDQLARNAFRGTAKAFAGDRRALALAQRLVASGADRALHPLQRAFVVLPFEHAESLPMQDEALRLFAALAPAHPQGESLVDFARRHRDIVARFGRFPHRNLVLGRASTAEELAFLQQPGSGF